MQDEEKAHLKLLYTTGLTTILTGAAVLLGVSGAAQAQTPAGSPLLFYRASDGLAATGVVDSIGNFTNLQTVGGFTTGWTHTTSTGGGRLLFYRASDGLAITGVVDSAGNFASLKTVGGFTIGWTRITLT